MDAFVIGYWLLGALLSGTVCIVIFIPIFLLGARVYPTKCKLLSTLFWRITLIWTCPVIALVGIPRDYLVNRPWSEIIAAPRDAHFIAAWGCFYRSDEHQPAPARKAFGSKDDFNCVGRAWYWRRNMSGLIGRDFGSRILTLEDQREWQGCPGFVSVCVFENKNHKEAVLVYELTGDSSSRRGAFTGYLREERGGWTTIAENFDEFDNPMEFVPYFLGRAFVAPSGIGVILLLVLLLLILVRSVLRSLRRVSACRPRPSVKRAFLMLPTVLLLSTVFFAWATLVTIAEQQVAIDRRVVLLRLLIAVLGFGAYGSYRIARRAERDQIAKRTSPLLGQSSQ